MRTSRWGERCQGGLSAPFPKVKGSPGAPDLGGGGMGRLSLHNPWSLAGCPRPLHNAWFPAEKGPWELGARLGFSDPTLQEFRVWFAI